MSFGEQFSVLPEEEIVSGLAEILSGDYGLSSPPLNMSRPMSLFVVERLCQKHLLWQSVDKHRKQFSVVAQKFRCKYNRNGHGIRDKVLEKMLGNDTPQAVELNDDVYRSVGSITIDGDKLEMASTNDSTSEIAVVPPHDDKVDQRRDDVEDKGEPNVPLKRRKKIDCFLKKIELSEEMKCSLLLKDTRQFSFNYTNILRKLLLDNGIPCVFCVKRVKKLQSFMVVYGYCKHEGCRTLKLTVTSQSVVVRSDVETLSPDHYSQKLTSVINREDRTLAKDVLLNKTAFNYRLDCVLKADESLMAEGNLQEIKSSAVVRKMKQEALSKNDLDKDPIISVIKMQRREFNNGDLYIQHVGSPLTCILFSSKQVKALKGLKQLLRKRAVAHIDATGSCIRDFKIEGKNVKRVYYYAFVCAFPPSNNRKHVIFPISEFVSCNHTTSDISSWLYKYASSLAPVRLSDLISKVVSDWSLAIIKSVVQVFNEMSLQSYLDKCFDWAVNDSAPKTGIVFISLCCSHFVKTVAQDVSKHANLNKQNRKHMIASICALVLCKTWLEFTVKFKYFCCLLLSESHTAIVDEGFKVLLSVSDEEALVAEWESTDREDAPPNSSPQYISNKFFLAAQAIKKDAVEFMKIDSTGVNVTTNVFHNPDFLNLFIKKYIPYLPLWSGIIQQSVNGRGRESNSIVEEYFNVVKNSVLQHESKLRIDRFITLVKKLKDAQVKIVECGIPSKRCTKKTTKNFPKRPKTCSITVIDDTKAQGTEIERDEETWGKKQKRKAVGYLSHTYAKKVLSAQPKSSSECIVTDSHCSKALCNGVPSIIQHKWNHVKDVDYYVSIDEKKMDKNLRAVVVARYRSHCGGIERLYISDLKTLTGKQWLIEGVIDAAIQIYVRRSSRPAMGLPAFVGTYCLDEKYYHWDLMNATIGEHEVLVVPININGNHWTLLIIDHSARTFSYCDSFNASEKQCRTIGMKYLQGIQLLFDRCHNEEYQLKSYSYRHLSTPMQQDGYNCGVHVLVNAERFLKNSNLSARIDCDAQRMVIFSDILANSLSMENICLSCSKEFQTRTKDSEIWIQCNVCSRWQHTFPECLGYVHEECALRLEEPDYVYVCHVCRASSHCNSV